MSQHKLAKNIIKKLLFFFANFANESPSYITLQPEEKKKKKDRDREFEVEPEIEEFHPSVKVEIEQPGDRPVRACRTQQGRSVSQPVQHQILYDRRTAH